MKNALRLECDMKFAICRAKRQTVEDKAGGIAGGTHWFDAFDAQLGTFDDLDKLAKEAQKNFGSFKSFLTDVDNYKKAHLHVTPPIDIYNEIQEHIKQPEERTTEQHSKTTLR